MSPLVTFHCSLRENLLEYTDSERDLGVGITCGFSFNEHCERIISKASKKLGLLRRICNFVNDTNRRRVLYLTLVRSQFEHCCKIWHPSYKTVIEKLNGYRKNA